MSLPHLSLQTFLILLVVGNGQGLRGIRLSSEEPVSARVVDHLDLNSSTPSSNTLNSTKHACSHPYGFLPCASNIPGYIFQIIVLEYLLLVGDKILTKGRQQLFSILGVGIYGATVFRILAVLPTIVLLLGMNIWKYSFSLVFFFLVVKPQWLAAGSLFHLFTFSPCLQHLGLLRTKRLLKLESRMESVLLLGLLFFTWHYSGEFAFFLVELK